MTLSLPMFGKCNEGLGSYCVHSSRIVSSLWIIMLLRDVDEAGGRVLQEKEYKNIFTLPYRLSAQNKGALISMRSVGNSPLTRARYVFCTCCDEIHCPITRAWSLLLHKSINPLVTRSKRWQEKTSVHQSLYQNQSFPLWFPPTEISAARANQTELGWR